MINAGAIATASLVAGETAGSAMAEDRRFDGAPSSGGIWTSTSDVYRSESETGYPQPRHRLDAQEFRHHRRRPDGVARELFPAVLDPGRLPRPRLHGRDAGERRRTSASPAARALPLEHVERVLSVMATCGMYDFAGSWVYEVGMPAKSGVGGGIIAVLPGTLRHRRLLAAPRPEREQRARHRGLRGTSRGLRPAMSSAGPATQAWPLGRVYTAAQAPSRRQPSPRCADYLNEHAHRIKYLCLHGFLAVDGIEYRHPPDDRRWQRTAPASFSTCIRSTASRKAPPACSTMPACALPEDNIAVVFSRIHRRHAIEHS